MDYSTPEVDTLFVVTGFGGIKTSSSLRGGNLSNGSAGTCQCQRLLQTRYYRRFTVFTVACV